MEMDAYQLAAAYNKLSNSEKAKFIDLVKRKESYVDTSKKINRSKITFKK